MPNKTSQEIVIHGVSISNGIVIGIPFFLLAEEEVIPRFKIASEEVDKEIQRYRYAIEKSKNDIKLLQQNYKNSNSIVDILSAHLEMLKDPLVNEAVEEKIRKTKQNTESVFDSVITQYTKRFKDITNDFAYRINDVVDISKRILHNLYPNRNEKKIKIPENSLLICNDIIPSDTLIDSSVSISGLITQRVGYTSHSAIIARAKAIPYIAKIDIEELKKLDIEKIIIDGSKGDIIVNPKIETERKYKKEKSDLKKYYEKLQEKTFFPAITSDDIKIKIFGNIETLNDITALDSCNSDGIGLFRSEYLVLMEKKFPDEEKQFQIYKEIAIRMKSLPVSIRLFDIGKDKKPSFHNQDHHKLNSSLGCHSLRYLIQNEKVLKQQLRAILRASVFGNVRIILPFVSDIDEFRLVKQKIDFYKEELLKEEKPFCENIPIGCMIEVPSSAILCDIFAKEADFISIGTNDLTQYVLLVDRANQHTSHLYSPIHPCILHILSQLVKVTNKNKKQLVLCGELAADPTYIKLLVGLGIREISVSARHIPIIKEAISKFSKKEAEKFAKKALTFFSLKELKQFLHK
jgi:phosphotransferase system enzyme I (PtsI)